jgi:hypothetical protein
VFGQSLKPVHVREHAPCTQLSPELHGLLVEQYVYMVSKVQVLLQVQGLVPEALRSQASPTSFLLLPHKETQVGAVPFQCPSDPQVRRVVELV